MRYLTSYVLASELKLFRLELSSELKYFLAQLFLFHLFQLNHHHHGQLPVALSTLMDPAMVCLQPLLLPSIYYDDNLHNNFFSQLNRL